MTRIVIASPAGGGELEVEQSVFDAGFFPGYFYVRTASGSPSNPLAVLDSDMTQVAADGSSAFTVQQRAALVPKWAASTPVTAGSIWMAPDGTTIQRKADGTTRASYDSTEQGMWTAKGGGTVTAANITDATTVGRSVLTAADESTARAAIGAGTSNLGLGTTSTTAKAGDYAPASDDITDASAVGRAVLTATDAPAARVQLGAIGAIILTPTGVATTDGPAMDAAVTQALSNHQPIYMRAGTYRRTTAWDCRGDGLTIITDGPLSVIVEQQVSNVPVIQIGKQFQRIGSMTLQYVTPQVAANTSANCVEVYKAYLGHYGTLDCYRGARGLYLPQVNYDLGNGDTVGNYLFSSQFEDIRVARYSVAGVDLQTFASTSTGCIFDNIYTINEDGGSTFSAARAVNFLAWDELNINQLNVEGVTVTGDAPALFNQVRAGKVTGLHFERVKQTVWGSGFVSVFNSLSRLSIDGMTVAFCPFASAAGGQADRLGLVKVGDGVQVNVNTLNQHDNTSLTAAERPVVVSDGLTSASVSIVASSNAGLTTTNELVGGTAPQLPVLKRLNDEWFHYREAAADVTFGAAAPTTGTWERGAKRWSTAPAAAGAPGWVCTAAGTPGTWKAMASLAA